MRVTARRLSQHLNRFYLERQPPHQLTVVHAGAPNERVLRAADMALLDMGAE
jgi:hypothetical protein